MIKQRKLGRPRSKNPMVHTAVVLPQDLLQRLKGDAERAERGLSTEIRERLSSGYNLEGPPSDPETNELVERIKSLADNLARDLGKKWHESSYAILAFKAGLAAFLAPYVPEGNEGARDIAGHSDDPLAVGRTHARLIMAERRGESGNSD